MDHNLKMSPAPAAMPDPEPPPSLGGSRDGAAGSGQSPPGWAGAGAPRLGRYRVGPLLGRGGMGEVRQAWDTLLGRKVALKLLTAPHPAAILRFLREAQLQARVTHPNVCRIYDVEAAGEVPFIAMQLVQGPDLLQAAPGLTVDQAVAILHTVALAINAAHRLNLIHRDIKPSNILLESDGQGGWSAFVADFGLAKDLGGTPATQTRFPMGTPEYMAPEQQRGDGGTLGPAVDVYALGATLQVVAGLAQQGATVAGRPPSRPGDRRFGKAVRGLPRGLRVILARCLEERPQDRYHSAGELAEDLRRYLDREPLLAQRGGWRRDLRRHLRTHRVLVGALALVLAVAAGSGAWFARMTARNQRQAALAQRFALDIRDLESFLRIERLIPPHDLRPVRALAYRRLEGIRRDMAELGPAAAGPGNLALGRGYAALGDLDQAQAALEAAQRSGYANAQVARALAQVHCAFSLAMSGDAWRGGAERSLAPLRAAHLREARAQFDRSGSPGDLEEAALRIQEGDYLTGLAEARAAFREAPWLYEAKVEEARALTGLGLVRAAKGEVQAAASLFRESELAVQSAEAIGQSDEAVTLADLDGRIRRLDLLRLDANAERLAWEAAERLADQALAINPDHPRALDAKVYVVLRGAGALLRAGRDPEPDLHRAERYLAPWVASPDLRPLVALRRRWIQCLRARQRLARGQAPDLDWALEETHGGIWTLEALVLGAQWAARRGGDPGPWLRAFWAHPEPDLPAADGPRRQELQTEARRLGPREMERVPR